MGEVFTITAKLRYPIDHIQILLDLYFWILEFIHLHLPQLFLAHSPKILLKRLHPHAQSIQRQALTQLTALP